MRSVVAAVVAIALLSLIAGPAAASHVTCGQTITTDTVLDSNVATCRGNGIVIGADNITLDLNGRVVDRDGTATTGAGIVNEGHDNVVVKNGTVKSFPVGVQVSDGSGFELRSVRVNDNTTGMALDGAVDTLIIGSFIFGGRISGLPGEGLILGDGTTGTRITGSRIAGTIGVHALGPASGATAGTLALTSSQFAGEDGPGVLLEDGTGSAFVEGNRFYFSTGDGIQAGEPSGAPHRLGANSAVGNGGLGIDAPPGTVDLGGNQATQNGDDAQCANVVCDKANTIMFGLPVSGPERTPLAGGSKRVSPFPVYAALTVRKLTVFIDGNGGATGSQVIRGVIYAHELGVGPGNRVNRTFQATIHAGATGRWVNLYFPFPFRLQGGAYYIGLLSGQDGGVARVAAETSARAGFTSDDDYVDGPSNPFGPALVDDLRMSVFASGSWSPP